MSKKIEETELSRLSHEDIMVLVQRGRAERSRFIVEHLGQWFTQLRASFRGLFSHPPASLRLRHH